MPFICSVAEQSPPREESLYPSEGTDASKSKQNILTKPLTYIFLIWGLLFFGLGMVLAFD